MPSACNNCGFPLDPGADCPRCTLSGTLPLEGGTTGPTTTHPRGPATIPPQPAWTTEARPVLANVDVETAPRREGTAFDRAHSQSRIPIPPASPDQTAAPLTSRAAAFAIDFGIVALIVLAYLAAGAVAYGISELKAAGEGDALEGAGRLLAEAPGLATACALLLFVVTSGYFVWFQGAESRTPGMALFGLRVVRADGSAIGMWGAMSRWGAFLLASALFGLGVLWTAFSEAQRGLHDHLSGTSVVRRA